MRKETGRTDKKNAYRKEVLRPVKDKQKIVKQRHWTTWYKTITSDKIDGPPASIGKARLGYLYVHQYAQGVQLWLYTEVGNGEIDEKTGKPKLGWIRIREGFTHPRPDLENYVLQMKDGDPRWVTYQHAQRTKKRKRMMRRFAAEE